MGRDDEKYIKLMDKYKTERLQNPESSVLYLEAAMKLRELGNVSDDAVLGGQYL